MTRIIRFPGTMNVPADWPKLEVLDVADGFDTHPDGPLGGKITPVGGRTWDATASALVSAGTLAIDPAMTGNATPQINTGRANYRASATLAAVGATPGSSGGGLALRSINSNNYIWLSTRISSGTSGYRFWEQSGAGTLAIGTQYDVAPKAGDRIEVTANGGTLTAKVNGVTACTAITTNTTGTGVGFLLHTQGKATRWDDFGVKYL